MYVDTLTMYNKKHDFDLNSIFEEKKQDEMATLIAEVRKSEHK